MKFNFKKISAIATSVLMTGMTIGSAMAAGIAPSDLGGQGNFAIVYGSTANSMDQAQATAIDTALRNQFSTGTSVVVGDVALTEDEIILGGAIGIKDISSPVKNKKLSSLVNDEITWNDGSGDDTYDLYEEISFGNDFNVSTTLTYDELDGVALIANEEDISYHLIIEKKFDPKYVGDNSGENESIVLPILGKEYEVISMSSSDNSIMVITSDEVALSVGQSYTLSNGKVVLLNGVFSESAEVTVDGVSKIISTTAKVNGVRVSVESIGYNSNAPETSRAVLRIGEDLQKKYKSGDPFIGEDEKNPNWVWNISIGTVDTTATKIGVTYDQPYDIDKETGLVYEGQGFVLPNSYAAITLDGLTDVDYQTVEFSFDTKFLYRGTFGDDIDDVRSETKQKVWVVSAENDDSISVGDYETDRIAFYSNSSGASEVLEVYAFLDEDGDYDSIGEFRYVGVAGTTTTKVLVEETTLDLTFTGDNATEYNLLVERGTENVMSLNASKTLDFLGEDKKSSNAKDVRFGDSLIDVSTTESEVMDYFGIILSEGTDVESQVENDKITLSVPEEQVFAKVSVSMGASTTSTGSVGNMIFRDTEASSYAGKNVVIVGGSCVNSAAATVLGVASDRGVPGCYADTGLSAGQFLIKKGLLNGKTAIVVAGYEADDTVKAAQFLINKGALEGKYSSTTSEIIA